MNFTIDLGNKNVISLLDPSLDTVLIEIPVGGIAGRHIIDKDRMKGAIRVMEKVLSFDEEGEWDEVVRDPELFKLLSHASGELHDFFICTAVALRIRHDFFEYVENLDDDYEEIENDNRKMVLKENESIQFEMGAGAADSQFIFPDTPHIELHIGTLLNAYDVLKDYGTRQVTTFIKKH